MLLKLFGNWTAISLKKTCSSLCNICVLTLQNLGLWQTLNSMNIWQTPQATGSGPHENGADHLLPPTPSSSTFSPTS